MPACTIPTQAQKAQPWKANWPPAKVDDQAQLTAEEMNLQRSYGTHASNTKGKIFVIDSKSKGKPRTSTFSIRYLREEPVQPSKA